MTNISRTGTKYTLTTVTVKQALDLLEKGATLVDVRSLDESGKASFGHNSLERIPILDLLDLVEQDKLDKEHTWIIADMDSELARKGANMLL
ncbi:MAG: hypothetical protein LWX70_16265, partial [Sphingobacteriia bacterium]|nr:hypothetical protein [Sphingobacteriia bacterium]